MYILLPYIIYLTRLLISIYREKFIQQNTVNLFNTIIFLYYNLLLADNGYPLVGMTRALGWLNFTFYLHNLFHKGEPHKC